ncbi:hypothetical protein OROMI_001848 [Orobanche minor]
MFYSQFILAKKGPLGTIWIAAHLERKLRKNQVADTDIGVSVDSILSPEVPIALRLSSHLLLGVVRIYNRKVNYLFDDCSEALLKVKQAFCSTDVDLPPEESKAPYHSITLPEKFDLDDFELPDSDIFQGNYVDHHISSREQITLQDSMEGVSYSTSKFGLDERFGDGDASGLDLDEELFLKKIGTAGDGDESSCPETMADGADEPADLMDYAQAPRTPGLVEEPNLLNAKSASACDDHMEIEYQLMESTVRENGNNVPYEDKQEVDWCFQNDTISNGVPHGQHEENGHLSSGLVIKVSELQGESPIKAIIPPSEFTDRIEAPDIPLQEDSLTEDVKEDKTIDETSGSDNHQGPSEVDLKKSASENSGLASTDQQVLEGVSAKGLASPGVEVPCCVGDTSDQQKSCDDGSGLASENQFGSFLETPETRAFQETTDPLNLEVHDKEVADSVVLLENPAATKSGNCISNDANVNSGLASTDQQVLEGVSAKGLASLGVEVPYCVGDTSDQQKSCDDGSGLASENQFGSFLETPETRAFQETTDPLNLEVHDKEVAGSVVLLENPDATKSGNSISNDANVNSDTVALEETYRREETMMPDFSTEHTLNKMQEHALGEEVEVAVGRADAQVHNINSQDNLVENSTEPELHAPEKLLSVPEGCMDSHRDMLVEVSPSVIEVFDIGDTRCKTAVGRKRSFTESTLTEQSLNSVESSRQVRVNRTAESVPDDDDLLSSILVGRKSSVLKVKPTPPLTEMTSMKRCRALPRSAVPKRKVLMDDTMVLHGDTIRHQLTNTEDIRRVRKKAPCTFAEITMIQKKQMEDDFFLGTIFTGISVGLASLHGQAYDLSRISICRDDANGPSLQTVTEASLPSENDKNDTFLDAVNGPSLETVTEARLPSQNDKNDASLDDANGPSLETVTEPRLPSCNDKNDAFLDDVNGPSPEIVTEARLPSLNDKNDAFLENFGSNLASLDEKYDVSRDTVAGSQLTSPNNENHDKGPGSNNVTDTSQQGVNLLVARNDEITIHFENPLRSENSLEGVNYTSTYVNFSQEQTKPTNDMEPNDSQVIPEVDPLDPNGHARGDIGGDTSVGMVQTDSLYESGERNSHVDMDASAVVLSAELDYVDGDGGQPIARNEVAEKDIDANMDGETGLGEKDDVLPGGTQDVAVEMVLDVNQGELENNLEAEIYSTALEGQKEVEFSREALVWGMEDGFMNNDENPSHSNAYQPNVMDVEVSGFDLRDQDDINHSAAGNDTEFLNVEDDELTEIADDHMPDGEETQYTDNSGWSSRTRAVSKYLHTAFAKEAECGRKFLSMDDILNGKSRKEASRMFFETLVLKTRDYIHVEQPNPHGEITIKPRTRLMKSDF